ncbi:MAG: hypothetical protein AAB260_00790, partial [Planctomycetota bacterium]
IGLKPGDIRQLDVEWCRDSASGESGLSFSPLERGDKGVCMTGPKPCPYKMVEPRLRYSLHEVSLRECLPFLQLADNPPKITIIGIQPRRVGPGMGLSPEVRDSIPEVIKVILGRLEVGD